MLCYVSGPRCIAADGKRVEDDESEGGGPNETVDLPESGGTRRFHSAQILPNCL